MTSQDSSSNEDLRPEENSAEPLKVRLLPRIRKDVTSNTFASPKLIHSLFKLSSQRLRIALSGEETCSEKVKARQTASNIIICHAPIDSSFISNSRKEITPITIESKENYTISKCLRSSESNWSTKVTQTFSGSLGSGDVSTYVSSLNIFSFDQQSSETTTIWEPRKISNTYKSCEEQIQPNANGISGENLQINILKDDSEDPNSFLIGVNRLRRIPNMKRYRKISKIDSFITVSSGRNRIQPEEYLHIEDFRSQLKLDSRSIAILRHLGQPDDSLIRNIYNYLVHFYQARTIDDESVFAWYLFEGYYPSKMLLEQPAWRDCSHEEIDTRILINKESFNRIHNNKKHIQLSETIARYMLSCYCRVLYEYSSQKKFENMGNFVLRARFAVFNLEQYAESCRLNLLEDSINYLNFIDWLFDHEEHTISLYDDSKMLARKRAEVGVDGGTAIYILNLEHIDKSYETGSVNHADYLSLQLQDKNRQNFEPAVPQAFSTFRCPIQSCESPLADSNFMAHFLHHHCRRMHELWLMDRAILIECPLHYAPNNHYCLNLFALKHHSTQEQLNWDLPANQLHFSEHIPCALMLSVVSRDSLLDCTENPGYLLYIFWIASIDYYPSNLSCRLYVYSKTHSSFNCGVRVLDFIELSQFQDIEQLLKDFEGQYIAVDHETMSTLTCNFTELIYIDVRYIDKDRYSPEDSADESQWND